MEFVTTSVLAAALCLGLAVLRPYRGLWVFMITLPLGAVAAVNLPRFGGTSILITDVAVVVLVLAMLLRRDGPGEAAGTLRPFQPGFWLLGVVVITVLSGLFFPRLFLGQTDVFVIARTEGVLGIVSRPLAPTYGNISQALRQVLSALAFVALATLFRRVPDPRPVVVAMAAATALTLVLALLDLGSHALGWPDALDWLRSANYQILDRQVVLGLKRLVAGYPEPAALGYYALGLFGFWLRMAIGGQPWALVATLALGALVLRTTSSAAYLALAMFLLLVLFWQFRSLRPAAMHPVQVGVLSGLGALIPLVTLGLVMAYGLVPGVASYFDTVLFGKLTSQSGVERMAWNRQAFVNLVDTRLVGAGIGAVRGSGWLGVTLASIGVLGTALYLGFLASVLRGQKRAERDPNLVVSALKYGCVAVFLQALLSRSVPNLDTAFFAMAGLSVGLGRGMMLRERPG
ncbi:MAG: hypothetical protein AB8B51_06365 [Sedimentitalea sp.]